MRENLGDFQKSIKILTFLSPLLHVPLPFTKRTCCTMILKRNIGASFTWILKKKYDYWWEKYWLEKTDRATKTPLFDRNWAISLKPRRKSRPLHLVWWALVDMSHHMDTLSWFQANQSMILLFKTVYLVQKQQIPIL